MDGTDEEEESRQHNRAHFRQVMEAALAAGVPPAQLLQLQLATHAQGIAATSRLRRLQAEKKREQVRQRTREAHTALAEELFRHYHAVYASVIGSDLDRKAGDLQHLAALSRSVPPAELFAAIDHFIAHYDVGDDSLVRTNGRTVRMFRFRLAGILEDAGQQSYFRRSVRQYHAHLEAAGLIAADEVAQ